MTTTPRQEAPRQAHPDASALFQRLGERAALDTAVVATLRRSSAYEPGHYPPAFPYIEPLTYGQGEWRRQATYLAAACWAKSRRQRDSNQQGPSLSLALGLRKLSQDPTNPHASKNIEKRFTALLDADADELPWRLRQITAVLDAASIDIDWPALLADLWHWNHPDRYVQVSWARQFWAPPSPSKKGATAEALAT
jgi:CRISPR system Cascade subunit CasB